MATPNYATKDKPIKGTTVLKRQNDPPNGPWITIAEFATPEEADRYLRAVNSHDALVKAVRDLLPFASKAVEELNSRMMGQLYPSINLAMLQGAEAALALAEGKPETKENP